MGDFVCALLFIHNHSRNERVCASNDRNETKSEYETNRTTTAQWNEVVRAQHMCVCVCSQYNSHIVAYMLTKWRLAQLSVAMK